MTAQNTYEVAVYYFPQYHADPRNDGWHGRGWTEWELLKAARPRFPGHRQPIVPAWGYFDESDPHYTAREIDLAADHGITTFLYDWYWYEEKLFLGDALEQGFLQAPNNQRLKFALMWANHDWLSLHPASFTNNPTVLCPGQVSRRTFEHMIDYIIERYFSRPNYLTINGAPYFSIYDLGNFIQGLGGLDEAREALDFFRARVQAAGFPDVHLNVVVMGFSTLPGEITLRDPAQLIAYLRFTSTTTYAWAHHYDFNHGVFPRASFEVVAEHNYTAWEDYRRSLPVPYYPNVSMGWDSSPRTIQSDCFEQRGYPWTSVLTDNTPSAFQAALLRAKQFIDRDDSEYKMCTLNAWNEWTEGSYLLPDTLHGTAYLEAVRAVFGNQRIPDR